MKRRYEQTTDGGWVASRLSRLQRRILAWLAAEEQRARGTMGGATRT